MRTPHVLFVFAVCLVVAVAVPPRETHSQIPGLPMLADDKGGTPLPPGVTREGQVETTAVRIDGRELFKIASPMVPDRAQPGALVPVETRARDVEAQLQLLLSPGVAGTGNGKTNEGGPATRVDPDTMRVVTETRNGQLTLFATDGRMTMPVELVTVTDSDAQNERVTHQELAGRWQEILEREIRSALERRQPEAARFRVIRIAAILLAAVAASALLGKASAVLTERRKLLWEQRQHAQEAAASRAASSQAARMKATASREAAAPGAHGSDPRLTARDVVAAERAERRERSLLSLVLREQAGSTRRYQIVRLLLSLVSWTIVFIWVAAIAGLFYEFPQTRGIADRIVFVPALILVASFTAGLANGLLGLLIDRVTNAWSQSEDPRRSLRVPTVAAALKGLAAAVLYTVAMIVVLEEVLVIPFTVVAIGAVGALALSFAAQNLMRDFLNGFLILAEDHYALGDEVQIGDAGGVVERLNLRITQLRTADGRLITIPNHQVNVVENSTRLWSRVDFRITMAYATDVDRALAVVTEAANEMSRDPKWRRVILAAPDVLGVEDLSHAGIVIRVQLETLPFKKDQAAREFRRRLKIALDRERITLGVPQQVISIETGRREPLVDRV